MMQIPSREQIVEAMAESINDSHPNVATKWNEIVRLSQKDGYMVAKEAVSTARTQAESALQAMLKLLPDYSYWSLVNGINEVEAGFYAQILEMRKET